MKKSRFAEDQIVFALNQAEVRTSVPEVCRKLGISDATFYIYGLPPFCKYCYLFFGIVGLFHGDVPLFEMEERQEASV